MKHLESEILSVCTQTALSILFPVPAADGSMWKADRGLEDAAEGFLLRLLGTMKD